MPTLAFAPMLLTALRREAEAAYPNEDCGILLGTETAHPAGPWRTVERLLLAENVHESSERYHRFTIDPRALLRAEREARTANQLVLGFYHSHPDHPAQPSPTDLAQAWPVYSYVIVSVEKGRAADTTSWRLTDAAPPAKPTFVEEPLIDLTPIDPESD